MERPNHLQAAPGNAGSKVTGLIIVIAIHVLAITGLVVALNQGAIMKQLQEIKATVDTEVAQEKAPPPPPPPMENVPPPAAIVPEFSVASAPPPPSVTTATPKPPPPPAPAGPSATKLEPIRSTFTQPPYPEVAKRLGEQGTTILKIVVGKDGRVASAEVQTSSGSERLDQAAAEWVKARYRYRPPTENGQPVEATTLLRMVWNLKNAG